ncbi:MAG: hypothetical protein V1748_06430 [Actinomycetota bacterium]
MGSEVKLGFVPASRGMFDQALAVSARDRCVDAFRRAGVEPVVPPGDLTPNGLVGSAADAAAAARMFRGEGVAGVVIGALNFGNEVPAALAAVDAGEGLPVMLFGLGEEGVLTREAPRRDAFCGLISIATALRHREARFVFPEKAVGLSDDSLAEALSRFGAVCGAVSGVRGAVYGQIGPRPAEFETCAYDELSLMRKFGIRVVPLPLSTIYARAAATPEKRNREAYAAMESSVDRSRVSDMGLAKMARLEVVLEELVEEHGLSGLGIQCWTSMQEDYGISPCFVMSRLTERGIPCACEADMHGTLSMHLLSLVAGSPAGLADWNNRHVSRENVFSAWHCGVFPGSFSSGEKRLGLHDILEQSTGTDEGKYGTIELSIEGGPVTMARVTEHPWDAWPLLLAEGRVVDAPGEPSGSHGWVEVADLDALYADILRGFPHHTAIARGSHGSTLAAAAYFLGLDVVAPLELEAGALEIGPEPH